MGLIALLLVCDQDDPAVPSSLLSAAMLGRGRPRAVRRRRALTLAALAELRRDVACAMLRGVPDDGGERVIARIGFFEDFDLSGREYVVETVKEQPGFRGVYHLVDRSSNRALSVSFWDDEDAAAAAQEAVGRARQAGGHGGPGPDRVETYEVIRRG